MRLLMKNLLFTLLVPGTVAVWLPRSLFSPNSPTPVWTFWGWIAFGVGGITYFWCLWDFASFGRGTPAPVDAPKKLVIRGLYRYSRNPMYLGVLTVILGWAARYRNVTLLLYGCGVLGLFNLVIILYEEPHLRREFGVAYESYLRRVGRWFSPRTFLRALRIGHSEEE